MKLYLISKNPIINKLVALSASKLGVEMVESQDLDTNISAELVLMDDECFEAESFAVYKEGNAEAKIILFYSKATERIEGFDTYIQKPFLPTDLVKTLSEISGISVEDSTKKNVESDILELDSSDDLGELNLDDELDLSNLDNLGLESDNDLNLDDGNTQLDFGGDDGLDNIDSTESVEQVQESDDLQVLDKSEVDTIKDLLDDSKEVVDDPLLGFDLDKELGEITDNAGDIEPTSTESIKEELEVAEQKEENQESALEAIEEPANLELDSTLETDNNLDFNLEDIIGADIENNAESKVKEEAENLELDLSDFDLGVEMDNTTSEKSQEVEKSENIESNLEEVEREESFDNAESLELDLDSNLESNLEDSTKETDSENIETAESASEDLTELESFNLDNNENIESSEKITDEISEQKVELDTDLPMDLKVDSDDEFATLSLEEMGEALGEPIQKEPIPAPIIAKEAPKSQEIQLPNNIPSSIQANSLDSLIGALQTLQTQALKELLSGATININIQFPKKDEN